MPNTDIVHEFKCGICEEEFEGKGNSAEPYAPGICCDDCNNMYVLPARHSQMTMILDGAEEKNS